MVLHVFTISCGLLAAAVVAHALWRLCRRPRAERLPRYFFIEALPPGACDRTKTWAQERCEFQRWTRTQRAWQSEMERLLQEERKR